MRVNSQCIHKGNISLITIKYGHLIIINQQLFFILEQKCTKRWKSLRDKFAREMKLCQESRWRYFKQMQFLVDSIRQYRESLLGKCANGSQSANQVADPSQQQQAQQQTVVDIFAQPFNGSATTSAQALTHPHGR